jgi:EpsI family protein
VAIHNLQGIVILLLGLILIYLVDGLLERFELFAPPAPPTPPGADAEPPARSSARREAVSVLTALACALTFGWLLVPEWEPALVERFDLAGAVDGAFEGRTSRPIDRDYYFQGRVYFRQQVDRRYVIDDHDQYVFVALADPIHRPGSALSPITQRPGSGWRMLEQERRALEPGGRIVDELVFEKGKQRLLVRHWSWGAQSIGVETARTLFGLDRSFFRRAHAPVLVRLATPIEDRSPEARSAAEERLARTSARLDPALLQLTGS